MPEFLLSDEGIKKRCPHCKVFKLHTPDFFAPMACRLHKELRAECRGCQQAYRARYRERTGK